MKLNSLLLLLVTIRQPVAEAQKHRRTQSTLPSDDRRMPNELKKFQKSETYTELVNLLMKQVMNEFENKPAHDERSQLEKRKSVGRNREFVDRERQTSKRIKETSLIIGLKVPQKNLREFKEKNKETQKEIKQAEKKIKQWQTTKRDLRASEQIAIFKREKILATEKSKSDATPEENDRSSVERIEVLFEDPYENQAQFNPKNKIFKIP